MIADLAQDRVEDLATDVVEVDVDPLGGKFAQPPAHVLGAVVDAGVEPEIVDDPAAFLRGTGDADHPAPDRLGDLARDRPDRARGTGHDHGFPGDRFTDVHHPDVSGQAGHPEDGQRLLVRHAVRDHLATAHHCQPLPAGRGDSRVPTG